MQTFSIKRLCCLKNRAENRTMSRFFRLKPFHFDIRHLAGCKMRLIDYMSRNPVGLPIPPSEYDEEIVVASINTFINNLEWIDNVILNKLADQNRAPDDLITNSQLFRIQKFSSATRLRSTRSTLKR